VPAVEEDERGKAKKEVGIPGKSDQFGESEKSLNHGGQDEDRNGKYQGEPESSPEIRHHMGMMILTSMLPMFHRHGLSIVAHSLMALFLFGTILMGKVLGMIMLGHPLPSFEFLI